MKKLMLVGLLVGMFSGFAFADEPAVVNEPTSAWQNLVRILDTAEPSGDAIFNVADGDFAFGSSIRLYSAESLPVPVVNDLDLRAGWFETKGAYLTLSL